MMKGARPSVNTGMMIRSIRMFAGRRRMALRPEERNSTIHTVEISCAITFAAAAPLTPHPKTKMNTGSRTMDAPVPMSTETMATVVLPCAEMKLFSPSVNCTKTVPIR